VAALRVKIIMMTMRMMIMIIMLGLQQGILLILQKRKQQLKVNY